MQITNTILMVRPANFRMNEQTATNNYFQKELSHLNGEINSKAQAEFDAFVKVLENKGVHVIVVEDTKEPDTPDALFPNNWVSFHADGSVGMYPMFAENRRFERREDIFDLLEEKGFEIDQIVDYSSAEEEEVFLEGTGSIALDRVNKKAYCSLSERADEELFIEFCEDFDYLPVIFNANQTVEGDRLPIYHTNVMMAIGESLAIVCVSAVDDTKERKNLIDHLESDGKEVIAITDAQMHQFAGNMLQVLGYGDQPYMVMSTSAYNSLTEEQREKINKHSEIIHSPLDTIETCGGGSARCMMAEVFLPKQAV